VNDSLQSVFDMKPGHAGFHLQWDTQL